MLRRLNAAATLRGLRVAGEATLTELASAVSLSRPTTEGALGELIIRGLVEEVPAQPGKGLGRPARRYRFRAEAGYALGLEIGADRAVLFVADLDGHVVATRRANLRAAWPPRQRLTAVRAAVRAGLAAAGVSRRQLWTVAAGTPGVVGPDGTVAYCTVLPDWQGIELARELSRSFPCPVLVENDANLAAVAERWRGAARDVDDLVYVLAGPHTGVGVVIGGRLHRGRWGAAGEVGVLPELGLRDTGAELSRAGLGAVAERMARGVAAVVLAIDPELVVVGGPLILAAGDLVAELRPHVAALGLSPTRIEASELGDESVALGALRTALDHIDTTLTTP
ncbi:ROK family protein [Actinomycetes bacterium KLBMP 9797]